MSEITKDYHQGFKDAIENIRKHYLQLEDYYAWDKGYYHKIFGDAVSIERQIFEYLRGKEEKDDQLSKIKEEV